MLSRPFTALLVAALPALGACSSTDEKGPADPKGYCGDHTAALIAAAGEPSAPSEALTEVPIEGSACNAVERSYAPQTGTHLSPCSDLEFGTNPPSSGNHYSVFPEFRSFPYAVPRGFTVHALEHGGVVLSYSCTDCQDEVAQANNLLALAQVPDRCCSASGCSDEETNLLLLTPDPGLSTRWAAASWGFTLTADCFEPEVFQAFADAHRASPQAPELICENTYAVDVTHEND